MSEQEIREHDIQFWLTKAAKEEAAAAEWEELGWKDEAKRRREQAGACLQRALYFETAQR